MATRSHGWIAISFVLCAGCSQNKSAVCVGNDVESAFTAAAKADSLMYEIIRHETPTPPFKTDPKWQELNTASEGLKRTLDENSMALDAAKAKCVSMPDEFGHSNAEVNLLTIGEAFTSTISKASIKNLNPAERRKIYTNICNGNFSDLSTGGALNDYKLNEFTFPNRYRFWYFKIKPLEDINISIDNRLIESEGRLRSYEVQYYENDFNKISFSIRDASLDMSNDTGTSYSCSANLYANIKGWNSSFRTVNYDVKITSDGNRRIQINKNDEYKLMIPGYHGL
jgi:hypothetical protein